MVDETGKVTFNEQEQAEVNRVISERLARDGVQDKNEIVDILKDFDYSGTPAEIKAALKAQADQYKVNKAEQAKQAELDALKEKAEEDGTSPAYEKRIKDLEDKIAASEKAKEDAIKAAEAKVKESTEWNKQVEDFSKEYPDVNLDGLNEDKKFAKFVKGKKGVPLKELYEDYLEVVGETADEAVKKATSKAARSTGSAAGGSGTGGIYGLTPHQQELAKENGMTFKEFSESLSLVKK